MFLNCLDNAKHKKIAGTKEPSPLSLAGFDNDLVIRYLDKVVVKEDGYEVAFKAGVSVEVEI